MSEEENSNSNIQANDNSIAIGGISVGGSVGGDIRIGHTIGFTSKQVSTLITQISTTFQPKPFDGRSPYKGLAVFEEEDAELFFGREKLVGDLLGRMKNSRAVFISGPSGSGKSSLVRAGLIHALKQGTQDFQSERWLYETMKPGRDPFAELARVTSSFAGTLGAGEDIRTKGLSDASVLAQWCNVALKEGRDRRAVIFVDQFEEVFTQITNEDQRVAFLNLLTYAATAENGRVIILFSMRSDFVSNCATYPQLNALLSQQFVQIGAMQPEELVSAIAQPALRVGLQIDPDLIAQIISDMKGEPGALPLMQFALKDLFDAQQAKGGLIALTLSDYLKHGGIDEALERHANESLAKLSEHEQELARNIFSGLIEIGRGTLDTRRTALSNELIPSGTEADVVKTVVQKLANARLITTDAVTVTISHEKLIDAWPWLKKLVNENREVIALQNEIASDAKEWDEHKCDPSYLYTGARLGNAREKLDVKKLALSGLAQSFVVAGIQMEESERLDEEKRRQKELDDARKLAATERRARLITNGVLILTVILVGALSYRPIQNEIWRQQAMGAALIEFSKGDADLGDPRWDSGDNKYYFYPKDTYPLSAFAIEPLLVTNQRYQKCVMANRCTQPLTAPTNYQGDENLQHPVSSIIASQAAQFCEWLGRRLPTDKEWELFAHKHGSTEQYEWTSTSYEYDISQPESTIEWTDLSRSPPDRLVFRGGETNQDQITIRISQPPYFPDDNAGFRCAISR